MTDSMSPYVTRRAFCAGLLAAPALPALAQALPRTPAGPVILTVTGAVGAGLPSKGLSFDLAMLDALPQRETVTATPWHEGTPSFGGPTLASILDAVEGHGATLRIKALNDYSVDMPIEDALTIPVILATRIDGETISLRNKGPLFVIYPFDEQPELYNELYFGRSVWQVAEIEILA